MKYAPHLYLGTGFYSDDDEMENYTEKIVKCRKIHQCAFCKKEIKIGDQALSEKAFLDGRPVSAYTCLPCIESWLVETGEVDNDEEEK